MKYLNKASFVSTIPSLRALSMIPAFTLNAKIKSIKHKAQSFYFTCKQHLSNNLSGKKVLPIESKD